MLKKKVKLEFSKSGIHEFFLESHDSTECKIYLKEFPDCVRINHNHQLAIKYRGEWIQSEQAFYIPCIHAADYLLAICEDANFCESFYFSTKNIKSLFDELILRSNLTSEQKKILKAKLPHRPTDEESDNDAETSEAIVARIKYYFDVYKSTTDYPTKSVSLHDHIKMIAKLQSRFPTIDAMELIAGYNLLDGLTFLDDDELPLHLIFDSYICISPEVLIENLPETPEKSSKTSFVSVQSNSCLSNFWESFGCATPNTLSSEEFVVAPTHSPAFSPRENNLSLIQQPKNVFIDYLAKQNQIKNISLDHPGDSVDGLIKLLPKLTSVKRLRISRGTYHPRALSDEQFILIIDAILASESKIETLIVQYQHKLREKSKKYFEEKLATYPFKKLDFKRTF